MSVLDKTNPFTVQLLAAENREDLKELRQIVDRSNRGSYVEEFIDRNSKVVYRLRIGLFRDRESAESLATNLKKMLQAQGITPYVTRMR
jgi:cell division septation protein DedD